MRGRGGEEDLLDGFPGPGLDRGFHVAADVVVDRDDSDCIRELVDCVPFGVVRLGDVDPHKGVFLSA